MAGPDAAQQELREWKRRYEFLFSNMMTGYAYHRMVLDAEGEPVDYEFLEINRIFEELTGLEAANVVGRTVRQILPGIEHSDFDWIGAYGKVAMQGERMQFDQYSQQLDRWYRVTAYCPKHGYFVAVFHDVTEYMKTQAELREKEAQLAQASRMEAIGRLAGGIAHDFNNLLTAVLGYADLLAARVADDPVGTRFLGNIHHAALSASRLTSQLLTFSRRQVLQVGRLDVNQVVRNVVEMLARTLGEGIELQVDLDDAPRTIRADESQMEQVIMNLVLNARDAMPDGGTVTITTRSQVLEAPYTSEGISVGAGRWTVVSVIDTGVGIDPETRDRIFEPFFTSKDFGRGTGLGLANVHGIVEQSDGHIAVYSEPGQGTRFAVYLPWDDGQPEPRDQEPASLRGGSETVLVCEDDEVIRALTRTVLEEAGYHVFAAAGVNAAQETLEQHGGTIDLLLTDMVLADGTGLDLIAGARRTWPELRVLASSGTMEPDMAARAAGLRDTPFLQKPFAALQLRSAVRGALDT